MPYSITALLSPLLTLEVFENHVKRYKVHIKLRQKKEAEGRVRAETLGNLKEGGG